jgi:hypothetical protein
VRLTLNGEAVDFTLQDERTLGDVVRGVQAWLDASGFQLTALAADGTDLLAAPAPSWAGRSVDGVAELAVIAAHTGAMRVEHWQTLGEWLRLVGGELGGTAADGDLLEELLRGLPDTLASFGANPFLPRGSDLGRRFQELFAGATAATVRQWPAARRAEARGILEGLAAALQARLADAVDPETAARRIAERLRSLQPGLGEVSVQFQTGRDRQGMQAVLEFIDAAQALVDLLPFLPPDAERGRLVTELTPVLRQLAEAFDAKDAILVGDLLEYEIAPRMERIIPLVGNAR